MRGGAGVRLGVGAIVVALALAGLAAQPWMRNGTPQRPPAGAGGMAAQRVERDSAADTPVTAPAQAAPEAADDGPADAAARDDERVVAAVAGEPERPPQIRLPAELEPVAPDVVVALQDPEPGQIVASHAHITDGADAPAGPKLERVDGPMATGDGTGQILAGPEPGAVYWFGPLGLEKVLVLTEEPR